MYPVLTAALDFPPAGDAGAAGGARVLLRVLIDAHGVVEAVSVIEASASVEFELHAVRALRAARFKPALRNGRVVRSSLLIEIEPSAGR